MLANGTITARKRVDWAIHRSLHREFRVKLASMWQSVYPSLLSGVIFDTNGVRFTPTHAVKNGKRYRYYTSQAAIKQADNKPGVTRFPAQELGTLVSAQIHHLLGAPRKYTASLEDSPDKDVATERALDLAKRWPKLEIWTQHEFIRNVLERVVVGQPAVWIEVDRLKLLETLLERKGESKTATAGGKRQHDTIKLTTAFRPHRRGGELYLVTPKSSSSDGAPIPCLVKAVARARDWYERIVDGEVSTLRELELKTGLTSTYRKRVLQCGMLSPQLTEATLTGKQPHTLTLRDLQGSVSIDWREQRDQILRLQ
jgi:site-specific DNA recombinase